MHQPQKRQTTRTPATQIQVSSQNLQRVFSAHFSIELGDIRHTTPTNGMYNVGVFDSIIEGETYARNAHPEVTRQRILDAAKKLFAQKGYERTTIQDILDELEDLSKGAIYHHFKNKEAMLHALIDSDNERLLPQANQEDGSRNGLQKLRNSLMMQITDTEHMTLMRDAFPLLNDPKILAENLRIWRTDSTKIAYDFIQEGLRDGSITTEYPQEAAELFSLLFNYWLAPNFYPITTLSEFKHRIHCLGLIMDSLGVPLIDHDSDMEDRLAEGFFLLASNPQ